MGENLSKIYTLLGTIRSYALNKTQQYRMIKGRVAPPNFLFQVSAQNKKSDIL